MEFLSSVFEYKRDSRFLFPGQQCTLTLYKLIHLLDIFPYSLYPESAVRYCSVKGTLILGSLFQGITLLFPRTMDLTFEVEKDTIKS